MNYGMKINITLWLENSIEEAVYHNVTEIHYMYQSKEQVAFESDIHGTGITWALSQVVEFDIEPEKEISKEF